MERWGRKRGYGRKVDEEARRIEGRARKERERVIRVGGHSETVVEYIESGRDQSATVEKRECEGQENRGERFRTTHLWI